MTISANFHYQATDNLAPFAPAFFLNDSPMLNNRKILIVEDDDIIVKAFKHLFEGVEIVWRETYTGCAEYMRLERPLPDLILLDLWLPDSGGHDTIEKIRVLKYYERPIFVMTGKGDEAIRLAALDAGAKSFADKPIRDIDLFLVEIDAVIRQSELDRELKQLSGDFGRAAAEVRKLISNGVGNGK